MLPRIQINAITTCRVWYDSLKSDISYYFSKNSHCPALPADVALVFEALNYLRKLCFLYIPWIGNDFTAVYWRGSEALMTEIHRVT